MENAKNNSQYVLDDLKESDIILFQETWLFQCDVNAGTLKNTYAAYDSHARGVDYNNPIPPTSLPRGYGGIAILWKTMLTPQVKKHDYGNNRIICIEIKSCYIINVYFPSGNKTVTIEEYLECADILESVVEQIPSSKHLIIAGDWNIDLFKNKNKNDKRKQRIVKFLKKFHLICLTGNPKPTNTDHKGNTSHRLYSHP